jgi:hypothetical protein
VFGDRTPGLAYVFPALRPESSQADNGPFSQCAQTRISIVRYRLSVWVWAMFTIVRGKVFGDRTPTPDLLFSSSVFN